MRYYIFFFLLCSNLKAWTLANGSIAHFPSDSIPLNVATNDSCSNAGISHAELLNEAFEAAEQYWNQAPTSRLRFRKGETKAVDAYSVNTGASGATKGEILIGCKNEADFASIGAIAVGGNSLAFPDGTITKAYVSIDGSASSTYDSLSKTERLAVLAHEIGHAIGLGHSEADSLMYYSVVPTREKLSEDDIAAVSFLYPNRADSLDVLGSCGTIASIGDNDGGKGPFQFLITISLGFLLMIILGKRPIQSLLSNRLYS